MEQTFTRTSIRKLIATGLAATMLVAGMAPANAWADDASGNTVANGNAGKIGDTINAGDTKLSIRKATEEEDGMLKVTVPTGIDLVAVKEATEHDSLTKDTTGSTSEKVKYHELITPQNATIVNDSTFGVKLSKIKVTEAEPFTFAESESNGDIKEASKNKSDALTLSISTNGGTTIDLGSVFEKKDDGGTSDGLGNWYMSASGTSQNELKFDIDGRIWNPENLTESESGFGYISWTFEATEDPNA